MDTLDRAAGLADNQVADALNKDWLLESAQSSQLSTDLKRYKLELSLNSTNSTGQHHYGATTTTTTHNSTQPPVRDDHHHHHHHHFNQSPINGPSIDNCNPMSWLRANYVHTNNNNQLNSSRSSNHLYDNISFAESPILRSLSRKDHHEHGDSSLQKSKEHYSNDPEAACCRCCCCCLRHKFRIFLACYVLFGITLAMYSRNALSLAAVGMVASNEINRQLVAILSKPPAAAAAAGNSTNLNQSASGAGVYLSPPDGSCPVYGVGLTSSLVQSEESASTREQLKRELELKLHSSIRQSIERGELVDWTPSQQGLIFAAGSLGNLLIAIPLSRLGELYGAKWIIFGASLGATIQAALMPLVSPSNVSLVILFQIIFNGLTFGADCVAYTFFAHWLPAQEMAFFVSCLLICYQLGTVISSFITAKILADGIAWSWCFYTPAIMCGLWTFVWAFIGSSEPSQSRFISNRELLFLLKHSKISSSLSSNSKNNNHHQSSSSSSSSSAAISWLKLAKDPNIWAIIAVKFTLRWYFSLYASMMPTYLSSVAHMSIGAIGRMSVVQSFISLALGILMGYLTKSLVSRRPFDLSLATTRKIFQSIVNFGLAISMTVFIMYDCSLWLTIMTLTLGGICINFYCAAALQLPLDLSPTHCGLITSITNTLALGQAIGAPISGLILNWGPKDRALWRVVWGLCIVMNAASGLIFILLVDSKPRDYTHDGCQSTSAGREAAEEEEGERGGEQQQVSRGARQTITTLGLAS